MVESVARAGGPTTVISRRKVPSQIGPRLRVQRERMGLSVREVARRVGLSASLISQIERDLVNPSVGTLYALVQELELAIGRGQQQSQYVRTAWLTEPTPGLVSLT